MNWTLLYGFAMIISFFLGVCLAIRRQGERLSVRAILSFPSVPRYVVSEFRALGLRGLGKVDLLAFLVSFALLALMLLIPMARWLLGAAE